MLLRTLGRTGLEGSNFTRPKPLLLLCYLALEGPQERRFLAELFWPEAHNPRKSLGVTLSKMRKGARGVVAADHQRAWATVETDAEQFLSALEAQDLTAALERYQGPFLHGLYLPTWGAELEEWVYQTREFLAERARGAQITCAELAAARGAFADAGKRAEEAYLMAGAAAPEPNILARLHTLMLAAHHPRAQRVADDAEAFGLELETSAESARARLQTSLDQTAPNIPHNLPLRNPRFVGRDLELTEVGTLLTESGSRLVTLLGQAGVGKTQLALQVAHEQLKLASFSGGVYLAPLGSLTSSAAFPLALADALGLELPPSDEPLLAVAARTGNQELLLVLDNAEHLAGLPEMIATLLARCPRVSLLVTSQERLRLEQETIFPVAGLPFPNTETLSIDDALRFDAVALFVQRAKRTRPDFLLTPEQLPAVLQLCRVSEGLPLGLELAASWTHVMPLEEIASEIETNLDMLTSRTRDVPDRHKSLRSAFEHAWALLNAHEQTALKTLSVFRGGFQRRAAAEVAGATIPVLASLVDKSLLRVDQRGRYTRHRLLYSYMQEKLAQTPTLQREMSAEHAQYFFTLAQACHAQLIRPDQQSDAEALQTLTLEHDNLRAALSWGLEHDPPLALQLTTTLRSFWEFRGFLSEACEYLEAALAGPLDDVPVRARFAAHTACGRFFLLRGMTERAQAMFEAALTLAKHSRNPRDLAEASNQLGLVALEQQRFARAASLCQRSLAVHQKHGNKRGIAITLNHLGNIARAQHHYAKAACHYQESLALHQELGIHRSEAIALGNLGFALVHLNDPVRAAGYLHESLKIRCDLADEIGLAHSLLGLAELLCSQQAHERAATLLGASDRLLQATSVRLALTDHQDHDRLESLARAKLTDKRFASAWQRGHDLSTDEAITWGLELAQAFASGAGLV